MGMCLLALVVSAALLAAGTTNRAYTIDDINAEMQDPQLRDIFNSAVHKMQDMTADTDVVQIEEAFTSLVAAMRRSIAHSFRKIRRQLFLDNVPQDNATAVGGIVGGGNSTELHKRGRLKVVDHLGNMDSFFRTWIPKVKKDIEMSALIMGQIALKLGDKAVQLSRRAAAELRRLPIKYGRLRRKLQSAFSRLDHADHAQVHRQRVIQSECGKQYTLEEFIEIFDHEHNLLLTEEDNWTDEFKAEFYEGWPVWANEMRLADPACGSRKWSLPPLDKDEL